VAVLMALRDRERTGRGQLIEMPLTEGFAPTLGEYLMDWHMNGRDTPSQANQHRWHAPHGAYPCAGADNWIAIDIAAVAEFSALCGQLGASDLATDPRFALATDRLRNRDALDAALGVRTADHDKEILFRSLQAVGVCAAPLHDPLEALADEQLNARGFFQELTIPGVGTHRYPGLTFRMARTPNHLRTPPPRLGEQNAEIYLGLLGYSRDQLSELERKGIVGTRYPRAILPKR